MTPTSVILSEAGVALARRPRVEGPHTRGKRHERHRAFSLCFVQSGVRMPCSAGAAARDTGSFDSVTASLRDPVTALRMTVVMREHRYFVYIVVSRTGTLYIGMTGGLGRRMTQHKAGEIEGFASKYHCDRLVYFEGFDDVYRAIGREKQLKGWTRARKIALIESKNPRWEDLAEKIGAQMAFAGEAIKGR